MTRLIFVLLIYEKTYLYAFKSYKLKYCLRLVILVLIKLINICLYIYQSYIQTLLEATFFSFSFLYFFLFLSIIIIFLIVGVP